VLQIHARPGERVGPEGIVELADTSVMYAVAEVYETDVGRVRIGQRARIRSQNPDAAADLTNLRVQVVFEP
jgi:HlyD family secretion protein